MVPSDVILAWEDVGDLRRIPAPRAVPGTGFGVLSRAVTGAETVTCPPEGFERELVAFFNSGQVLLDSFKARRELGIEHRPLEDGIRAYLGWVLEQLGMTS